MNTKKLIWPTVAIAFFSGSSALAQESLLEYVLNTCENDIQSYCSQVTPGDGRLMYCMAAHEDKISGQCQYAFYDAVTLLEQLTATIAYFARQCETEIETICSDVELGDGRLLACLDEKEEEVGETCKAAIAATVEEADE